MAGPTAPTSLGAGDVLLSPANYDAYARALGSDKRAEDFDVQVAHALAAGVGDRKDFKGLDLARAHAAGVNFDLSDVRPDLVPLDRVEFRREVELKPGVWTQTIELGRKVKRRGGLPHEDIEVFAWLDGDYVVLSTGQEMHVAGGLVDLFVRGA